MGLKKKSGEEIYVKIVEHQKHEDAKKSVPVSLAIELIAIERYMFKKYHIPRNTHMVKFRIIT